jgi:hypothetical protein
LLAGTIGEDIFARLLKYFIIKDHKSFLILQVRWTFRDVPAFQIEVGEG